jgi:hypothetical protein
MNDKMAVIKLVNDLERMADWLIDNVIDFELDLQQETLNELILKVDNVSDVLHTITAQTTIKTKEFYYG